MDLLLVHVLKAYNALFDSVNARVYGALWGFVFVVHVSVFGIIDPADD